MQDILIGGFKYSKRGMEVGLICLLYPPQTVFVGGYTVFMLSDRPTNRVSVTFCFLNILKNHRWNFIKFCKHIHMYKINATNKGKGPILLELFPFVILIGFCIVFSQYLKESLMEFHQTLQKHSYLQDNHF